MLWFSTMLRADLAMAARSSAGSDSTAVILAARSSLSFG